MRLRAGTLWICGLGALSALGPPRDELLPRIRYHMQQRLSAVPNYTCQETIERSERLPKAKKFREIDKILLEVAQVAGRELLTRPGGKFESRPLAAFARSGLISNGAFAMHARSIFFGDRATFTLVSGGGPKLVRYDFKVPQSRSGYRVKGGGASAVVGYRGSLFANPDTLDVARLEIHSDPIPHDVDMSKADMVIEYQAVRIGTTEALLPKTAEVTIVQRESHRLQRNLITFSGCRQYGSESVISFLPPEEAPPVDVPLPAGLLLPVQLQTALDSERVEAGTPILAVVDEDVMDAGRLLIPKGAKLSGYVRSVQAYEIGLEFSEVRWPGARARFTAEPESATVHLSKLNPVYKIVLRILP